MPPIKVVPVIDLMGGLVVRGIAGERERYQPIISKLVDNPNPAAVARALVDRFAVETIYVADLDAIQFGRPDFPAYRAIAEVGVRLWLDAGVADSCVATETWRRLAERQIDADLVLGLETLQSPQSLAEMVVRFGAERLIFSLDLRRGVPLTSIPDWSELSPVDIGRIVYGYGIRRMILLDLAAVGMNRGVPTLDLCQTLSEEISDLELCGGGGVRGDQDLVEMARRGFTAALVAGALHDGRIGCRPPAN